MKTVRGGVGACPLQLGRLQAQKSVPVQDSIRASAGVELQRLVRPGHNGCQPEAISVHA